MATGGAVFAAGVGVVGSRTKEHAGIRRCRGRGVALATALLAAACASPTGTTAVVGTAVVVNTLSDAEPPVPGLSLRMAIGLAGPGGLITFDPSLDGGTIVLGLVGQPHTMLPGEVYAPAYAGYQDRDYGPSALFVPWSLTIDASALPHGIALRWGGGEGNRARVLAVRGDLSLINVTIAGGYSSAEPTGDAAQPFTLARGGGLAVWGTARLSRVTVTGNRIAGDNSASRDRGTYGGGIYANGLELSDCVVSGNSAIGYGAAGGGIYSVGGADREGGTGNDTRLTRCAVTGNRVTAQHAYGGGIFTLSGGPDNLATMTLTNCTVARNLVEDHPGLPEAGQYYTRGGGIYIGGGSLTLVNTTIAENAVIGQPAVFSGKPNLGGGGLAATIGNAHTVEDVKLRQSILVGNTLNGRTEDWFTGSLISMASQGYNLVGVLDASQMLVPAPAWSTLSRKHWPKPGDRVGVTPPEALDLAQVQRHASLPSAGTDAGQPAVLWYPPGPAAVDQVPAAGYSVTSVIAEYDGYGEPTDDFLNRVIWTLRRDYGAVLGPNFGSALGDLSGVTFYGPPETWVTAAENQPWINAWRAIEAEIGGRLGPVGLGDDFWGAWSGGQVGTVRLSVIHDTERYGVEASDQRGGRRSASGTSDIGAVER